MVGEEYKSVTTTLEKARMISSSCSLRSLCFGSGIEGIDVALSSRDSSVILTLLMFWSLQNSLMALVVIISSLLTATGISAVFRNGPQDLASSASDIAGVSGTH